MDYESALRGIRASIAIDRDLMREHDGYIGDNTGLLHLSDEQARIALRYGIPIGMCSQTDNYHGSREGEYSYTLVTSMEDIQKCRGLRMYEDRPSIYPYLSDPQKMLDYIGQITELEKGAAQELNVTEKLYSPVTFYLRSREDAMNGVYDDIHYWRDEISHEDAFAHMAEIKAELADDRRRFDNGRGLAEYLDEPLGSKVQSLIPYIELHGDKLWTVADLRLNEPLTPDEMVELKEQWEGQLSDGWGEGFEQRSIAVDEGDLYVEPWSAERDFFIDTQAEFDRRMGIVRHAPTISSEPEPTPDLHAKKQELFSRLDKNLSDFCDAIGNTDKAELIGMAEEIATRFGVRDYLKHNHHFNETELDFLLQFKSPLTVVSEHTPPMPTLLDMSGAISELANMDGALRREYPMEQQYAAIQESFDARDALLTQIAKKHCRVETLEERHSDDLDFHELGVWDLKEALEAAFKAGAAQERAAGIEQPDITPAADEQALRQALTVRLDQNIAERMAYLQARIAAPGLPQADVVALAEQIAATSAAHGYLQEHNFLPAETMQFLLQFQNPLEMVAERWPVAKDDLLDFSMVLDDVMEDSYSIDPTANDPVVAEPPREPPAAGKPSLLAGLREAQARAATENAARAKDKPTIKPEPEL